MTTYRAMCLAALIGMTVTAAAVAAPPPDTATDRQSLRRTPVVEVFQTCRDAVVNISSTEVVEVRDPFDSLFEGVFDRKRFRSPRNRHYKRTSIGSGFIIHPDGYIVTNAHVVARSTDTTVTFADGREVDARVVASDRDLDLAVLKIEMPGSLEPIHLGTSRDLMIGETVVAIGNPLGYQHTLTAGVISAIGRDLEFSEELVLRGLIQTDASINPGNSGGPLLNVLGELIGVNTAVRGDAQNIGFAIPVDQLRALLPELLDVERRQRIVSGLELGSDREARVVAVASESPAAAAGIKPGDVIRSFDGTPLGDSVDYHIGLLGKTGGDIIRLGIERRGSRFQADLRLRTRAKPDGYRLAQQLLGIEVTELPRSLAEDLRLRGGSGLVVVDVAEGSPADIAGMEPRDVVVGIGRYQAGTLDELGQLLEFVQSGDDVALSFLRLRPPRIVRYRASITAK